jgi:hypothetical protein
MRLLNNHESLHISGGEHHLTVTIDAPSDQVGQAVAIFCGFLADGRIKTTYDFMFQFKFLLNYKLYLVNTKLVDIEYH